MDPDRTAATPFEFATLPKRSLRPGDVLLFQRDFRVAGVAIRRVQERLLLDLGLGAEEAADCSRYTHAALCAWLPGRGACVAEMTSPRARVVPLDELPPGEVVMVRRPQACGRDAGLRRCRRAADHALAECAAGPEYPWRELFAYWVWSLRVGKLGLGRHFRDLFADPGRDVCSGSVWRWLRDVHLFTGDRLFEHPEDDLPEAWYPARLAADRQFFRTLGVYALAEPAIAEA